MASADVMAITKWSILPWAPQPFYCASQAIEYRRVAWRCFLLWASPHDLAAPAHARGFLLPSVRRRVRTFAVRPVRADCRRRRHQPRRPVLAKSRPGRPAPTMGHGRIEGADCAWLGLRPGGEIDTRPTCLRASPPPRGGPFGGAFLKALEPTEAPKEKPRRRRGPLIRRNYAESWLS
jgi:hypothetical protein